jgi:hypothetical protein
MLDQIHREMLLAVSAMGSRCFGFAGPAMKRHNMFKDAYDVEDTRVLLHDLERDGYLSKKLNDAHVPHWTLTVKGVNTL